METFQITVIGPKFEIGDDIIARNDVDLEKLSNTTWGKVVKNLLNFTISQGGVNVINTQITFHEDYHYKQSVLFRSRLGSVWLPSFYFRRVDDVISSGNNG